MRMQAKNVIRPSHCSFSMFLKIKGFSCRPKATCLTTLMDKKRPISRNPNRGVGVGGTVGMRGVGTLLMRAHKASPKFQLSPRVATVRRRTAALGCWHSFHPYRHNAPPVPTALSRPPRLQRYRAYSAIAPPIYLYEACCNRKTDNSLHTY